LEGGEAVAARLFTLAPIKELKIGLAIEEATRTPSMDESLAMPDPTIALCTDSVQGWDRIFKNRSLQLNISGKRDGDIHT
jgi:hypothetical protein